MATKDRGAANCVARLPARLDWQPRPQASNCPTTEKRSRAQRSCIPSITRLVEESDGLLLLGVILSDTNFAVSARKIDMRRAILAIDREVHIGHHLYPDIPMDALIDALLSRAGSRRRPAGVGPAAQQVPKPMPSFTDAWRWSTLLLLRH